MKKSRILIGFVIVVLGLAIIYLFDKDKNENQISSNDMGSYYDPYSGETVSDPEGKSPEDYGETNKMVLLGMGGLLDHGLTQDQLGAYRVALDQYSAKNNNYVKEASIVVNTIERFDEATTTSIKNGLKFDLVINRESRLQARLEYTGLSALKLYLTDPINDQLIFESREESKYYE